MNVVLAGIWVLAAFIISGLLLAYSIFGSGLIQGESVRDMALAQGERMRTAIDISQAISSGDTITLEVGNEGSTTLVEMSQMDVYVQYTSSSDVPVTTRLAYATTGPGGDEWVRSSLSPDSYNPALWDPGEEATLDLKVAQTIKAGSVVTAVVSTPNGVTASRSWTHS